MKNILFPVRNTGRLICAWVATDNAKNPLACVWTDIPSSRAASTAQPSPADEVGRVPLCA